MRWIFWFLLVVNIVVFAATWLQHKVGGGESSSVVANELTPGAGVKRLTLLPNVSIPEKSASNGNKEDLVSEPLGDAGEPMCTLIGPFDEILQAEYLVENANALGVEGRVGTLQVPGDMTYWVYLPPEISRKAALRRLHELQSKDLDSYVIPKGELENGISFGMFSRKALAENLQASLQAQGYPVLLKEVAKMRAQTWVVFSAHNAALLDNKTWLNLLKGTPSVEQRQNFCSTVAPE